MERLLVLTTLLAALSGTRGYLKYCDKYPKEVDKCFAEAHRHPVPLKDAHEACIRKYYIDNEPDLNITKHDRAFFDQRVKHKYGLTPPPTGFRIRKEYRRLTKDERIRLHNAFNILYKKGIVHKFARLHATASESIHRGAAFLPWHRIFITDFEEELRRVDPDVALAYWDYTMDNNITRPSDSVVWTPCFFGNGNGTIIEGPFRGWYGGRNGPIQRDFARDECDNGRLVNKFDVLNVLGKCHLGEISSPPEGGRCNLEVLHDGPHMWVGGDMNDLQLSAYDPVFYFHHAFTDHVWELFRRNQALKCKVNPETDYPPDFMCGDKPGHRAFDLAAGYEHLRMIDTLTNNLPFNYFNYEPFPTCPECGPSEFLYCDFKQFICLTREKDACDMQRDERGVHTYTGRGDDGIGFPGSLTPSFTPFTIKENVKPLRGDGRHRDMSRKEAMRVLMEESKTNFGHAIGVPFSPVMGLMPPSFSSFPGFGGHISMSLGSQGWPLALNSGLQGFDINGKNRYYERLNPQPMNMGFMPFRHPGASEFMPSSGPRLGPYRNMFPSYSGMSPPRSPFGLNMQPPRRNFYNFSPQVFPSFQKKHGKGYY